MATVNIENVEKRFDDVQVLRDISLDINDGEFIVLVGPSGCGKSTLLRIVSGLEYQSEGTVKIGGIVMNDVAPKDRDIAMVFQSYALYPHMNVRDNLSFSLTIRDVDAQEIERRVNQASQVLGLSELLDRRPKQLSGGQRQRVAMGRAIVRDPQVFLFDEPLSNLDAKLRVQMRKEIKELHQRLKSTAIYVTHDQIEAMTMADRVVVMRDGIIEQVGSPLELYDLPANKFVAGFIGAPAMNFLDGTVIETDNGLRVQVEGHLLPMPVQHGALPGTEVAYAVRPEHIQMSESEHALEATISVVEPTGSETLIECALGDKRVQLVVRERIALLPGDRICLNFDENHIHLFDAATDVRL